jgi:hypothetical protein
MNVILNRAHRSEESSVAFLLRKNGSLRMTAGLGMNGYHKTEVSLRLLHKMTLTVDTIAITT